MYQPQEDSLLLQKYVKQYAYGNVLDVGTGTGIQAETAAGKADFVVAVDIDPEAIQYCQDRQEHENILFVESDLFSAFQEVKDKKVFDVIIFNAPYLPTNEKDADVALDGGKEGHELIQRFLSQVNPFLDEHGIILMIFSSQTGDVPSIITEQGFSYEELEKQHIFFEDIYCYKLWKKNSSPRESGD